MVLRSPKKMSHTAPNPHSPTKSSSIDEKSTSRASSSPLNHNPNNRLKLICAVPRGRHPAATHGSERHRPCRKSDLAIAAQASEAVAKLFKELSGGDIAFEVDDSLGDGVGGVRFISGSKRITLDNTLDERRCHWKIGCHPRSERSSSVLMRIASFIH
ncbi:uncharacterized protein LACBIDRAFT_307166 [Laccaria bicolor S238N-H82]|uniref:Predicted protein n=1 Tax=Laccaria bicolor (strain S238N-H82 / ATCC MYA-4686) TaxID=486041 RepID=B0DPI6_LACBS|nr:uncharacterized protein LACBIDRAFT_307166 [Laccaria bicolor S238N-H82]EDR03456.1 predicted protein [Laccaria bicolor S238N-H82]|eukprot:XP_001885912.1 predicted protein [Laccaria bicolor S238N-H82]